MPYRPEPLVTGEVYHIFNRSIARVPIFQNSTDYRRAIDLIDFYRFSKPGIRFSHFNRLEIGTRASFLESLYQSPLLIEIYAFCLMPNHFHFLVKQISDGGIIRFARIFQDSYAKYLNTKTKRSGAAFQSAFKSIRIESEEQLTHLFRYIHLNPLTSYVIKNFVELERYPWCSFGDYVGNPKSHFLSKDMFNGYFRDEEKLLQFHRDQVDYQRTLERIKHLLLEER